LSSGALPCTPCGRFTSQPAYNAALRLLRTTRVLRVALGVDSVAAEELMEAEA